MLWRKLLTRRPGRWPLRARLAAAAVCLLAAGAGIIVVAAGVATRDHLTRQAGQQLRGYAGQLARHPFLLTPLVRAAPGPAGRAELTAAGAGPLSVEVRSPGGQLILRTGPARAGQGSYLAVAEPIRYRAFRIPYAYSAQDFALDVTSPSGAGARGTLVVSLSLARVGQATGRLTAVMLAVSGIVVLAAGCLAAWVIRALLRPLGRLESRAGAIAAGGSLARRSSGQPRGGPARMAPVPDARVAPALDAALTRLERAGDASAGPGPAVRQARHGRQAIAQRRQAIADISAELRAPLSVLGGLTEYYRHRDQLSPAVFHGLLARVVAETTRITTLVEALEATGQDQPGPPGARENVGGGA